MKYIVKRFSRISKDGNEYLNHLERVGFQSNNNNKNHLTPNDIANIKSNSKSIGIMADKVTTNENLMNNIRSGNKSDINKYIQQVNKDADKESRKEYNRYLRNQGIKRSVKTLGIANLKAIKDRITKGKMKSERDINYINPRSLKIKEAYDEDKTNYIDYDIKSK